MEKKNFFDTSVVISYASYSPEAINAEIVEKCHNYIKNARGIFMLCHYVISEINNRIKKRRIMYDEVLRKMKHPMHLIGGSGKGRDLSDNDIPYAKKLYELNKNIPIEDTSIKFNNEQLKFERQIYNFLKNLVKERVIPLNEISHELVNILHDFITTYADCKVLASALQAQQEQAIFYFVTADKKDLSPNQYGYLKEHFEINYPKEKYRFPELHNLMFAR